MTTSSVEFSFEFCGEKYKCFYVVEGAEPEIIRVSTPWGPRACALGHSSPIVIARLIAAEAAHEAMLH